MQKIIFIFSLLITTHFAFGQQQVKIVLRVQSKDTLVYKAIVNQIGNLKKEFPQTAIELVYHEPGVFVK